MATLDESFYDPVPGYTQTRRRRTETPPPADVPRGGMGVLTGYAEPDSATRSMRYGPGDERDLSVPVPPAPPAMAGGTWGAPVTAGGRTTWRSTMGGEASIAGAPPPVEDISAPRPLFSGMGGQSLAETARLGAAAQAEQDKLGLTTADMDYIRNYGRDAWNARQAKYAPPTTRADYLARQGQNLAISVAERNAAQQELSRIDADRRRQDALAADAARMAAQLRMAEAANRPAPVSFGAGAGATPNADGGWDYQTPPQETRAPAPVSFGGGAGLIPDGNGGWTVTRPETAPAPDQFRPVALGGGGMGVYNPEKGSWEIQVPPKQGEKGARAVTLKPGESYYDPETNETYVAPGADRASIEAEIANLTASLAKADTAKQIAAIEKQLEQARARLASLGAQAAPAPAAIAAAPVAPAAPAAPAAPVAPADPAAQDPWAMYGGLYK